MYGRVKDLGGGMILWLGFTLELVMKISMLLKRYGHFSKDISN
jgi:hypothetical protein